MKKLEKLEMASIQGGFNEDFMEGFCKTLGVGTAVLTFASPLLRVGSLVAKAVLGADMAGAAVGLGPCTLK